LLFSVLMSEKLRHVYPPYDDLGYREV
jgi:hypothetical protein